MPPLFAPAIALMNRLTYARKAVLLGTVSLAAVAVVTFNLYTHLAAAIAFSKRELAGLELIDPVSRAIQGVQENRGLCMMILAGDETFGHRHAIRVGDVDAALEALKGKLSAIPALQDGLRGIVVAWETLRKNQAGQTLDGCFDAHTQLVIRLQEFKQDITDAHWLTLDPDHQAYWLIESSFRRLPVAIERLGQLRAYGVRVLGEKQVSAARKTHLHVLVASLEMALGELQSDMERAARYNPTIRAAVLALLADITDASHRVIDVTRSDLLGDRPALAPDAFFTLATASIDQVYARLRETMVPMTAKLLQKRLKEAEDTLRASLGIALALFLIAGYLTVGGYFAVVGSIQSLARSARAFARGDLHERVRLDTRDELAIVSNSFNEMADGFSALLDEQRRDAARLRELSVHLEERVAERTREVERAARRNEVVLATTMDGFWLANLEGVVEEVNQAYAHMSGYTREELVGMRIPELEASEQPEETRAHIEKIEVEGSDRFETRHRRKDGSVIDVEVSVTLLPEFRKLVVFSRDITERKRAEEEIRQLAFYDTLTELPNRRLFMERMRAALPASARRQDYGAVLFIDMDRFKTLNDTFGHDQGDLMLIQVARRLKACVRAMDTVARLGGDEFVVLIEDAGADEPEAARRAGTVAEKIREALTCPYPLDGHEFCSSPSIGIALFHGHDASVDTLLKHADVAMYQAKAAGRNAVRFFDPTLPGAAECVD